jgi:CMP-N,N'-diacetyllegionaminic acid synthase
MLEAWAIIPARSGSKSIPWKNIKRLAGKPLIYYTVCEAKKSKRFSRIIVSTDSKKIAKIAKRYGAETVMRPAKLATDKVRTELALIHVLDTIKKREGLMPDIVVTLEPTSPLRTFQTIDRCIKTLLSESVDSVITVAETSSLVGRIQNGQFQYLIKNQPRRRQDRKPLYKESSTVYATKTDVLLKWMSVIGKKLGAVVIPQEEAIDINTPLDFVIAEAVMRWRKRSFDQ